jgi:hypothetical protein
MAHDSAGAIALGMSLYTVDYRGKTKKKRNGYAQEGMSGCRCEHQKL